MYTHLCTSLIYTCTSKVDLCVHMRDVIYLVTLAWGTQKHKPGSQTGPKGNRGPTVPEARCGGVEGPRRLYSILVEHNQQTVALVHSTNALVVPGGNGPSVQGRVSSQITKLVIKTWSA